MSALTDKKSYILLAGWCAAAFLMILLLYQVSSSGNKVSDGITKTVYTVINPAGLLERADVINAINRFEGEQAPEKAFPELTISVAVLLFAGLLLPAVFLFFSQKEERHGKAGWMISGTLLILICCEIIPAGIMRVSNFMDNREQAGLSELNDKVRSEAAIHAYEVAEYMVRVQSTTAPEVINKGTLPVNYEVTSWDDSLAVIKASLIIDSGDQITYRLELTPYENPSVKIKNLRGTGLSITGID